MTNLFINIDFGANPSVDNGSRPYTGSTPLWDNASIFMEGGSSQTQTSVGTPTTVRVRVSNTGQATVDAVSVDAYLMNPFVGAFNPAHALVRMHGFASQITAGSGGSAATDSHVVPCYVQSAAGPIPWAPTQAELSSSTNGHLCLVANAYADNDGAPLPDAPLFAVGSDPHQGQRNIALFAAQGQQMMKFVVMPGANGESTALDIHELPASVALHGGEHWLLRSRANIVAMDTRVGLGIPARGGRPAIPLTLSRKSVRGTLELDGLGAVNLHEVARATKAASGASARARGRNNWGAGRLVLAATGAPTAAAIAVERSDEPGSLQAFDIVQRDSQGRVLGGLRVLSMQR
jgi:hypothetical protein